jgi:uncharacterized protein GlcG (DUF336 family)
MTSITSTNSNLPRMRTARIITSSRVVIDAARKMGVSVCVAYVDASGYTRLLWRDPRAELGGLLRAESAAWTTVVQLNQYLPVDVFIESRRRSNLVYNLQENEISTTFEEGGTPMLVGNTVIGAVAVIGANLNELAVTAYMGSSQFDPSQTNHFSAFDTSKMKTVHKRRKNDYDSS